MTKKQKKPLNNYIKFSSLAFQMAITIYIGAKFGQWLDLKFETPKKVFTAICGLLAVIFSLINLIRRFKT